MAWATTYYNIIERHGLIDCFSIRFDYVVQVSCQRIPCEYDRLRAPVSSIARQGMKMKLGPFQLVEVSNITNQAIYTTLRVLTASATTQWPYTQQSVTVTVRTVASVKIKLS